MALIALNRDPAPRVLRTFTVLGCLMALGLAVAFHHEGRNLAMGVAMGVGAVVAIGFWSRAWARALFVGISVATYPLGFVVSHLLLALTYFVVFTLLGRVMRLFGYDPLRTRVTEAKSYWEERKGSRSPASYFKQY